MAADVSVLNILLYGKSVGTLTRVDGDRTLFAFNDAYINDQQRPTLSLGFKDNHGALITEFNPVQTRVLPFFSNILPEGRMRSYLAEQADTNPKREFFLLWVLGKDLPGAITVEPADGELWPPDANETPTAEQEERRQNALRFSLAGVQLKFSAIESAGRKGLTIPAKGIGGSWIVKLPSREFESVPENEYSMMTLAQLIGMDVPPVKLVDIDAIENLPKGVETLKGQALAIQRFDRLSDGSLVHIEDFAQIFRVYPADKYGKASAMNIAKVIAAEGTDEDIAEFVRRLTFNSLIGNADMHLKNWSVIYPDKRNAALAPAYDFVSTIPYMPDETAALKFSRTKRFDGFSEDELKHMAARALLPEKIVLDAARETVALFHEHWKAEKNQLPLTKSIVEKIEEHVRKVPIASA
ncbi:MAG: kinase [Gammaproteobacteria bacterium]|nr:kinase [Gammaproteobacteria bacterium]|tara:strand:+ start:10628 stop:11860 length:1233 start_codon:yes stop_codon:yes gene_type:complete